MSSNEQQASFESQFSSMNLGKPQQQPDLSNYGANASNPQSASARFERFFNTGPPASDPYGQGPLNTTMASGMPQVYQPYGTMPPGSVAAGGFGSMPRGQGASFRSKTTGRNGLPSQWNPDPSSLSPHTGTSSPLSPGGGLSSPPTGYYNAQLPGSNPGSGFLNNGVVGQSATDPTDDDVIPTAIVVKNIPFSVKKEQLIQIIEDLAIPMPYAFNYHYDQGVFRGLAFANFRSPEEADAVVAALNGFDVSGRKLRVEYKKVLQAGEKERIEKEKAIKRMRSMQMEKERIRRETEFGPGAYGSAAPPLPGQSSPLPPPPALGVEPPPPSTGAYGDLGINAPSFAGSQSPGSLSPPTGGASLTADALQSLPSSANGGPSAPSERSGISKKEELDLNDPQTLEIYSRVLLFKDDRMRDELAFSRNLSPMERRVVHLVAQRLNLYHYSIGESDERHVIVTKHEVNQGGGQSRPLRSQASTIGRSQRGDVANSFLNPGSAAGTGSRAAALRAKKSAPDMKRARDYAEGNSPGAGLPAGGAGGASGFHFGSGTLGANGLGAGSGNGYSGNPAATLARKSNSNLRDGYSSTVGRRGPAGVIGGAAGLQSLFSSPFEVPPVPSLGAAYLNNNNSGSGSAASDQNQQQQQQQQQGQQQRSDSPSSAGGSLSAGTNALRQPRGPPTPGQSTESRNFVPRSRITVSQNAQQSSQGGDNASRQYDDASSSAASSRSTSGSGPGSTGGGSGGNAGGYTGYEQQQHHHHFDAQSHEPLEI